MKNYLVSRYCAGEIGTDEAVRRSVTDEVWDKENDEVYALRAFPTLKPTRRRILRRLRFVHPLIRS